MTLRPDLSAEFFTTRRHPDYQAKLAHWNFLELTYAGGPEWFEENIHPYFREGEKEFKERKKRGYRFNHTREIVDLVTKYVFKNEVSRRTDAPKQIQDFWKLSMKGGRDINALMREISRDTSSMGQPYVVVDCTAKAPEEGGPRTLADQVKSRDRAFAYVVRPQDALDMSYDDLGELNWILFREHGRDDAEFGKTIVSTVRYRLWTRTHVYLFEVREPTMEEKGKIKTLPAGSVTTFKPSAETATAQKSYVVEQISVVNHNLGIVPVVPARDRDSDSPYHSAALVEDIAYLDRAVANYLSNLDAIIQDQTFSTLTIPVQSIDAAGSEDAYNVLLEAGTKRIFAYDGEGGKGPEYISPDPSQAQLIMGVITKIITEIYHSVGMAGERTKTDNAQGIDNSSGVAKAYDFDRMNTMLKAKADRLQEVENKVLNIVMRWHGKTEDLEVYAKYPDEFDTRNLYDEFDVANRLTLLAAPEELRRHQMATLVAKLYPNLSADLREKIEQEIAKWPPEPTVSLEHPGQNRDRTVPKQDNKQGQNVKKDEAA